MELLQLRYFQKVAELQSVTQAARFFSVPQPSVSQSIARLERDLNVKLFERQNGKLFLNEKGKTFLRYAERSLQELDNGIAAVTNDPDRISGTVKIKVMENHRFILTCIPKFTRLYPDVSIQISHGYSEDPDTVYDLCVSAQSAYQRMTTSVPLLRERVVLAVHESHPFARQKAVTFSQLEGQKLISLSAQSKLYDLTVLHSREQGFEPNIPITCDDPYFVRKYVSEGMGIALAPSISWKGRFRENTVLVDITNPDLYVSSYLLLDDRRYTSSAVRKFREFLLEEAKCFENK